MKDGLQQDILDKKIDLTKDLADKINKAPEADGASPMGPDIVKDRQKLEAAVSYIAGSNPHHAAEMEKYMACDKDNTAKNLIIMTGAELRGKPVHDTLSSIPQIGPALGKVFGGIFGVEGAYDALGHIEEHNKECELKEILDQPNSEEITHKKLCEETQKQAKENPFGPPKPTILPPWSVSAESKITPILQDIAAPKKTITLPVDLPPERSVQILGQTESHNTYPIPGGVLGNNPGSIVNQLTPFPILEANIPFPVQPEPKLNKWPQVYGAKINKNKNKKAHV
jgi:hypothetical protein